MPTHIRAQVEWQVGSALPRDKICITPHFRHQSILGGEGPEWQPLADDLAAAISTWDQANNQVTVKLYDIGVTEKPNRPRAIAIVNPGNVAEAAQVREIALCLSFYGGPNAPHNRGRLYLPAAFIQGTGQLAVRPTSANRDRAGTLAPALADLGGVDVDWIVWSPTRNAATRVENWWVDDEWDVQRRRGLQPSARTTGTTSG